MAQKSCLKVILEEKYVSYGAAREMCNLKTLHERREDRCMSFAMKCLKHPVHTKLLTFNHSNQGNKYKSREKYLVNFPRTETYKLSAITQKKTEQWLKCVNVNMLMLTNIVVNKSLYRCITIIQRQLNQ